MNNYYAVIALLLFGSSCSGHAGVVAGGTRFIFDADAGSLSITLKNTDSATWLVKSTINNTLQWPGAEPIHGMTPFTVTPPLFALAGEKENKIRIVKTAEDLPVDRESLYELLITAIPSGKMEKNSVQVALRSRYKLIYRPPGLSGIPEQAYQQIHWQWRQDGSLEIGNPTPYYVTLTSVRVNGNIEENAGVVAPFSQRSVSWCQNTTLCKVQWRTLDDVGKELTAMNITLTQAP
ncbi:Chaperone protein fimC precursor [Citrobacter europaeus]|nr:fimbria/pilus periplasmic chaperone [Citrobacter europaeus]UBI15552.1 fimbria/pilus periplasmic chaperone [Citrobacter europaeus]CAD7563374.1 Chaperone protein fimC precursor [Citrobacter europaeus]